MPRLVRILTPRQQQVASLMAQGMSNTAVAAALFTAVRTVERHIGDIGKRMGIDPTDSSVSLRGVIVAEWVKQSTIDPAEALEAERPELESPMPEIKALREDTDLRDLLTPRQLEALRWVAMGYRNEAVGVKLGINHRTVEHHITAISQVLGIKTNESYSTRVAAVLRYWIWNGGLCRKPDSETVQGYLESIPEYAQY